ncbi:MAG TPA: PF20097 family protein [Usitatibacter sp.]|nr:PF20097 family protein [Usitatibacter sp.]
MSKQCPKCGKAMEQGFVPDYTYGGQTVGAWYKGPPSKSFWVGTKLPPAGGLPIGAFRCAGCGLLELYAGAEFAAK